MNLTALRTNPSINAVHDALKKTEADLYIVGGALRDTLIGNPLRDIDMVIAGLALPEVERILANLGRVDVIGKRFAVIRVTFSDGSRIDIALPRIDDSFGTGRHKDVRVRADPSLPIEHDLARRDFTINAMAWHVATQQLIDPFGGRNDLKHKVLRAVGAPHERFQEDSTRILRGARFTAELGLAIEPATLDGMRAHLDLLLDTIITPREIVAQELIKGFSSFPVRMLDALEITGITATILPEVAALRGCTQPVAYHAEGDVYVHTRRALEALIDDSFTKEFGKTPPSPQLIIATLLHDIGKPVVRAVDADGHIRFDGHSHAGVAIARDICTRTKLSSAGYVDPELTAWLVMHHLDHFNLDHMRPSTIERTFLSPDGRGLLLQQLIWADSRASLDHDEVTRKKLFHEPRRYRTLTARLALLKDTDSDASVPPPLLTGDEIIDLLHIEAGPLVGSLLESLRDAQLDGNVRTKDEALQFIREHHAA